MSGVTKEQLKKEIAEILKNADLTVLSAKKVRLQLEQKLGCDLMARKKEVDALVMQYVNSQEKNNVSGSDDDDESDDGSDDDDDEESDDEPPKNKRSAAPARKPPVKKPSKNNKKKSSSDDEEDESASAEESAASDEEYSPSKSAPKSKAAIGKKRKESDSDSDEDWKKPPVVKKAKKAAGTGGGAAKGKGTGFTRALTLSPELAALMGAESLPRHEVVKKMWAMIKERNLYDPKNKQYAICDNDLIKVIGVKRFRTFGMLKYLRQHFID